MHVSGDRLAPAGQVDQLREQLAAARSELQLVQSQARMLRQEVEAARGARQRSSDILRDILYSSPVATFLLDRALQVEFFSPPAESLFRVLSSDVGRPFAELGLGVEDPALEDDILAVLSGAAPERAGSVMVQGSRYNRRIVPRRARDRSVDGVVISYSATTATPEPDPPVASRTQVSEMRHEVLQPLQTLRLLHGVLRRRSAHPGDLALLNRLEEAAEAVSGTLGALFLQMELAGTGPTPELGQEVSLADILAPLRLEFGYHAAARGIECRMVRCSAPVRTDPGLFTGLVRMLAFHALRQANGGRLLVGVRRRGSDLRLELWRTPGPAARGGGAAAVMVAEPLPDTCLRLARILGVEIAAGPDSGPTCIVLVPPADSTPRRTPAEPRTRAPEPAPATAPQAGHRVCLIDDDGAVLRAIGSALETAGMDAVSFTSVAAFLAAFPRLDPECLIVDARMPGTDGFSLIERLRRDGCPLPFIMITGAGDVRMAVRAMQAGATDFLEKPVSVSQLVEAIDRACAAARGRAGIAADAAPPRIFDLTPRQMQVMDLVVEGHANKEIAARLNISQRTVENHRAAVMRRTGARSLSDLVRMRLAPQAAPAAATAPPAPRPDPRGRGGAAPLPDQPLRP